MLLLVFAMILFLFLLVGAVAFLICAGIPPLRRFALSTALWCAFCGPSSIAFMSVAGLSLAAAAFVGDQGGSLLDQPHHFSAFGWTYLSVGVFLTAILASAAAWLHQFLIHRLTFPLFRLYATVVVAGIGSVFGWTFSWWMLAHEIAFAWAWSLPVMAVLIVGFGLAAFKGASHLRGKAPKKLTWITEEEFTQP